MKIGIFARRILPVTLFIVLISLVAVPVSSSSPAKEDSSSATILLRATLLQSVTVSVAPEVNPVTSFISSGSERDFPVTIKTNWVRGPGNVSIAVISTKRLESVGVSEPMVVIDSNSLGLDPSQLPELRIQSRDLQLPAHRENEVLTIRAQVL